MHNLSHNHGIEGPTDDPEILSVRFRQMRNILATLILSRGTPMILGGDEFARTQGGNNNAYCQDNEISWFDWEGIDLQGRALACFVQKLLAIRRALPMLRRGRFLTGEVDAESGVKDVTWLDPAGSEMEAEHWADPHGRCMGILLDGRAQETGIRRIGSDSTLLMIMNAHHDVVPFVLPEASGGSRWVRLVDTNADEDGTLHEFPFGRTYDVAGRSFLLFVLRPARGAGGLDDAHRSFLHVIEAVETVGATPLVPERGREN